MSLVYSALVHHPVRDREGLTASASVTNIDVHDIARSSHTFGLAGMYVTTPIDAQRALVTTILEHWRHGAGKRRMPHRSEALAICQPVESIAAACEQIAARHGQAPRVVATAARAAADVPVLSFAALRTQLEAASDEQPWLVLFGTGHGLTDDVLAAADLLLEPIRGHGEYNHLSVRAAAAIVFDRLFGQR